MLVFTFIIIIMFLSTLSKTPTGASPKEINNSHSTPSPSDNEGNTFLGFNTYQLYGNEILEFVFQDLSLSSVKINRSEEYIQIEVNNTQNAQDFKDKKFIGKNIEVDQRGKSLTFTINTRGLTNRYLIQQHNNSIKLNILAPGLAGKRITIDPGHGGIDSGAVGPSGLFEKDVVLDISLRLYELLKEAGAQVAITRDSDSRAFPGTHQGDLIQRAEFATEFNSHMFISVHNNASVHKSARGIETLYNRRTVNAAQSREFAILLQKNLSEDLNGRNRGILDRDIIHLRPDNHVSVLTEIFFITNPEEERIMKQPDFPERAAQSIFRAIKDFYGN